MLGKVRATAYQDIGPEVQKAGTYLQNAVASFVRDPVHGLESFGWPRYNVNGKLKFSNCFHMFSPLLQVMATNLSQQNVLRIRWMR